MIYDSDHIFSGDPTLPGILETIRAAGVHTENFDGTVYVSDPGLAAQLAGVFKPLAWVIAQQRTTAGDQWWTIRTGGHTTAAGVPVKTDDSSIALITGACQRAQTDPSAVFNFRDANGTWRTLTAAEMIALFNDVSAWMQAVFDVWHGYDAQILAGTDWQAVQAIDVTRNWPA